MKVANLSKQEANNYCEDDKFFLYDPVWISINIPVHNYPWPSNENLEKCENLKIAFWDIEEVVPDLRNPGKYCDPPSEEQAAIIVDFLLKHRGRAVIVNCHAGISRSGAVAAFCRNKLGYEWHFGENRAYPNKRLYRMMCDYYNQVEPEGQLLTALEKALLR